MAKVFKTKELQVNEELELNVTDTLSTLEENENNENKELPLINEENEILDDKKNKKSKSKKSTSDKNDPKKKLVEDKSNQIKKNKSRKYLIVALVGVTLVSAGFGIGFGVNWNKMGDYINPDIDTSGLVNDEMNQVNHLKSYSAYWAYDQLHYKYGLTNDSEYNKTMNDVEKAADNQINNEKESYRSQYGKSWEDQWNDYLISLGYDTESEYRDSLISQSLKDKTDSIILDNSISFVSADETDINQFRYHSTLADIDSGGTGYWVINKGQPLAEGQISPNIEGLFQGYVNLTNPISYYDLLLPFTFGGTTSFNGLYGSRINFNDVSGSNVNLQSLWDFSAYYCESYYYTIKEPTLIKKNFNSLPTATSTQTSLNAVSENQFVSNALLEMFLQDISTNFVVPESNFSNVAENFYYVNDLIGKTSLLPQYNIDSPDGSEVWPGYIYNSSNPSNSTTPTTVDAKLNSIKSVQNGPSTGTEVDYFNRILTSQSEIIGLSLFANIQNTSLFTNSGRSLYLQVPLNYNSVYYQYNNSDDSYLSFNEDATSNPDPANSQLESVYLVVDNTGMHVLAPTIYYDQTLNTGDYSYGELMLIGDLDRKALEGSTDTKPPASLTKQNFDTWFRASSSDIYLNAALQDEEFVTTYLTDLNSDGVVENTIESADYQLAITNFYNDFYNAQQNKYFAKASAFWTFYDTYYGFYNFDSYNISSNYDIIENSLIFFQKTSEYSWTPTLSILTEGILNGSVVK